MTTEIWKDVVGFEGLYKISNLGKIKGMKTGTILSPFLGYGYPSVKLQKDNKQHNAKIHRVIAQAFIPNPNNLPCINHKDENKENNSIDNLEWCTHKYNSNYGTFPEKISQAQSIPVIQKTKDGEIIKIYKSRIQAERETGIDNGNICACTHGKYKTAGGFIWESIEVENCYI